MKSSLSTAAFSEACDLFPGGVNSPVRSFKSVEATPFFVEKGNGPYLTDIDGNTYIDYVLSWGPLALGHANKTVVDAICKQAALGTSYGACTTLEAELGKRIKAHLPSMERMRFVNSGTEATMSAIRLARGFTGKTKVIKFSGNYHGHADFLLAKSGSGLATFSLPDAAGVPEKSTEDTIILPYNDVDAAEQMFQSYGKDIACVIVEPVAGNMGCILPKPGFLQTLQKLCQTHEALFIMDEVMTGFRVSLKGAQGLWDLKPDLTCLGKVIGGGLPVGAFGGRKDVMDKLAPLGPVYQAGTLSGNPLAMAAGIAMLEQFTVDSFEKVSEQTAKLIIGINAIAKKYGVPLQTQKCGTMFGFCFLKTSSDSIENFEQGNAYNDTKRYADFFKAMLTEGVYFAPSAFEAGFLSTTHDNKIIDATLHAVERFFSK